MLIIEKQPFLLFLWESRQSNVVFNMIKHKQSSFETKQMIEKRITGEQLLIQRSLLMLVWNNIILGALSWFGLYIIGLSYACSAKNFCFKQNILNYVLYANTEVYRIYSTCYYTLTTSFSCLNLDGVPSPENRLLTSNYFSRFFLRKIQFFF
jgi:hypothetical protein